METVSTSVLPRFILFWNMKKKLGLEIQNLSSRRQLSLELVKYSQGYINTSPLAHLITPPILPWCCDYKCSILDLKRKK